MWIDWSKVNLDARVESILNVMKKELADKPELLERLGVVTALGVKV